MFFNSGINLINNSPFSGFEFHCFFAVYVLPSSNDHDHVCVEDYVDEILLELILGFP